MSDPLERLEAKVNKDFATMWGRTAALADAVNVLLSTSNSPAIRVALKKQLSGSYSASATREFKKGYESALNEITSDLLAEREAT